MIEKISTNNQEKIDLSIFNEYFPDGKIEEITIDEVPENAMEYFESKSSQFTTSDNYIPKNFEKFFVINHAENNQTYLAQQTKTYDNIDETEKLTYFVDINNGAIEGRSELRFNIRCKKENEIYFKNKPFTGWTDTEENARRKGLGTRRIFMMNAFSQMMHGFPLYSDTVITFEAKKMWEKLVSQGKAKKFKEDSNDRYVLQLEKN